MESINKYKCKNFHVVPDIETNVNTWDKCYVLIPDRIWKEGYQTLQEVGRMYPGILNSNYVRISFKLIYNLTCIPRYYQYLTGNDRIKKQQKTIDKLINRRIQVKIANDKSIMV